MYRNLSLKFKLVMSFLILSMVPVVSIFIYNDQKLETSLKDSVKSKILAQRDGKLNEVKMYFDTIRSQVLTLSHSTMVSDATVEFIEEYNSIEVPENLGAMKTSVNGFYEQAFKTKYDKESGKKADLSALLSGVEDKDYVLQYSFISNNENALGEKHNLHSSNVVPGYSEVHKRYHPSIAEYLEKFGYYDIFIIDINSGRIVYSVFKELDYSTSLLTGPYKTSNLAKVFNAAKTINDKSQVSFVDFEQYTPSYEAPASFIASPIWNGGKKVGVLAFQMPVDAINGLMNLRSGMGETGESYLVGKDHFLRSNTFVNSEKYNLVSSFRKGLKVNSESIKKSLEGKSGIERVKNYVGEDVFSAFTTFKFEGVTWAVISEITSNESLSTLYDVRKETVIFGIIFSIFIVGAGFVVANKLSNNISHIVETLSGSSHVVQNSSHKLSLVSEETKKLVSSQADNIQQTATAMNEISSMLERNNSSSERAFSLSEDTKKSASTSLGIVDKMVNDIKGIASSYDDISTSVEQNNEDITKIVSVISDISSKTEVINDIVFQTKLLSFNASVEAARAGEHGKGFAVVAEEVGNLATMSGKAANEISEMLAESIEQVNKIAESTKVKITRIVNDGKVKIEQGSNVADECKKELNHIGSLIENLNGSIAEITAASREQMTGINDVENAMNSLDEMTAKIKKMSNTTEDSANVLLDQSKDLRQGIEELRQIVKAKKMMHKQEIVKAREENKELEENVKKVA